MIKKINQSLLTHTLIAIIYFILIFDSRLAIAKEGETTPIKYLESLQDSDCYIFIEELLKKYWTISKLPIERLPIILEILQCHTEEPELAISLIFKQFPDLVDRSSSFYQNYQGARDERIKMFSDLLIPYIQGTVIADVGGGDGNMVEQIMSRVPTIEKAYVTDIVNSSNKSNNSKVEFVWQKSPENTSLLPNSISNVILSTVLHHIEPETRAHFLSHIIEILEEEGRLIVIEDSYPQNFQKEDLHSDLDLKFSLLSQKQKKDILGFFDWWGNRFLKNKIEIPIPCTFQTIEEWKQTFDDLGLKEINIQYLGIPEIHAHVMVPKTILVYEKASILSPSLDSPHGCSIQRAELNGELFAFLPNSQEGLNINLSIGGSKIGVGIIDAKKNVILQPDEYLWRNEFLNENISSDVEIARDWFLNKIVDQISSSLKKLTFKQIEKIEGMGIAWPGPVSTDGLILNSNIEGFKLHQLKTEEKILGGIPFAKLLKEKIERKFGEVEWKICILNDGDAAAIANFSRKDISDGILLTIGTGIGSGIISGKEVLFGAKGFECRIGELGHHIYYHPQANRYFYYGAETNGHVLFEMTMHSFSERLSGPALAKRFLHKLKNEMAQNFNLISIYLNSESFNSAIKFNKLELAACEKEQDLGPALEKKILGLVSCKGSKRESYALDFIEETGYELGLALGVFIKEFEKELYTQNVVLSGGIGRNFAKGVYDERGRDVFLTKIKQGVEWSQKKHNPEMNKLIFGYQEIFSTN
jgi:ubiquinone/menaquinone biosynthesis C-methylase UbiE